MLRALMLRTLLPRFALVVVAAPAAFVGAWFACVRFGVDVAPAALLTAITFAAVVTAPSTRNAAVRAVLLVAVAALAALFALAVR